MKSHIDQDNEEMFFTVQNNDGEEVECEILFTFEDQQTGKNYVVYTDHLRDEEGNNKVYANEFDPNNSEMSLLPIEEERIWKVTEQRLAAFQEEYAEEDAEEEN